MRLEDRIARRRNRGESRRRIVRDVTVLNPTVHPDEPTGRGPTLEMLLDHLDPVFDGSLPTHAYVHGPKGAGKSALVTSLFDHISRAIPSPQSVIYTTTRAVQPPTISFSYVDARAAQTEFTLLHAVLDDLSEEEVPSQGVGVESLRSRLVDRLTHDNRAVVAVDHVGEPMTYSAETAIETLADASPHVSVVTVGRDERPALEADVTDIEIPAYERHALADVLAERGSDAITRTALTHDVTNTIADWADGDAHDALSALYGAATLAAADEADAIEPEYVTAGIDAVPEDGCSLGRVFALSENRRQVLRAFVELDDDECESVTSATEAIAAHPSVSLSQTTVRRVLYELSDLGIVRRVAVAETTDGPGRPATRPVPNFSTLVFRGIDGPDR
ncbi:Cdc6/Cdc18 family protein [Haloferax larsenii]|uniref:Cdc6-related protein, AAA superfamily ATPase n=1 Tax=Haloferax larsenii TaxID=302484 RepID=A0A1H7SSQ4_HALLR|nr:AAA family ATPase [Haloferax larsenii]SEL75573.1 Cdc6-related protein, AAA superfamily ATPase [Haloferax larsenii]